MISNKKVKGLLDDLSNGEKIETTAIPLYQITYMENTGFGVYICEDEKERQFNIKGTFVSPLILGQTYLVKGYITTYKSSYGTEKQITVDTIRNIKPVNKKGIIAYLQTLKGLKSRAYDIYKKYGDKSIDILIEDPMLIAKTVKGIGKKSVLSWQSQLEKMKESQYTITKLLEYGLTAKQAKKLYETYKDSIITKIEHNPYLLSTEVKGYGFLSCDRIAMSIGYDVKSPNRIKEGIIYVLNEALNSGHCYLPYNELLEEVKELLRIRISVPDMNKFAKQFVNDEEFGYYVGETCYTINYKEMMESLNAYKSAKYKDKNKSRHLVVDIKDDEVIEEFKSLSMQRRITIKDEKVYLTDYYEKELNVAFNVRRIINGEVEHPWDIKSALNNYCKTNNIELEDKQKEAVYQFAQSTGGFHILNGSAGCGKTYTLKIILKMLNTLFVKKHIKPKIMLMAPTGKASKVATRATKMECVTVHRGLMYSPISGFEYNEDNPLPADIIIVDESSMLDISLADHLFSAVKNGCKVILLGDTKQLPSVGAGNVLKDLIDCGKAKVVTLNVVKRQNDQSGIIKNANLIIEGKMIETREDTKDAFIIRRYEPRTIQDGIVESIKRIQKTRGYSLEDIQVLCPQKAGSIGVEYMNYLLQQTFNPNNEENQVLNKRLAIKLDPNRDEITKVNLYFKKGDKIIHIKNNYDIPWYEKTPFGYKPMGDKYTGITNGECGFIEDIIKEKDSDGLTVTKIIARYDDMYIIYDDGVSEIDHAYALTIHKSQGSEWKVVLIPMMMQNYIMLDNNLFYTAYTRAKELIATIGQERAIEHAIKTYKSRERYTTLKEVV